jgi:hypothetical protein
MTTSAPAATGSTSAAAPAPVTASFRGSAPRTIQRPGNILSAQLSTAPQGFPTQNIPAITIIRDILIEVTATTTGNSASVAFQPDAPLNVFSNINFRQAGAGGTIFGGFSSYLAAMAVKWFGYPGANNDIRANATTTQTTGSGSTAGSFSFVLRIPVEVVQRTGVGSLPATTTQSPLALDLTLNQLNAIYSTAPTVAPTVTVVISWAGYANTTGSPDGYARPANFGTMNAVQAATVPGSIQGQQTFNVPNVGFGNTYRNAAFVNYATGGARSDGAFPATFDIKFRNSDLLNYSQMTWKQQMSQNWGYTNTTQDAAGGLDTGVYIWTFADDFDRGVGAELGNAYQQVGTGDNITVAGNWPSASNLTYLVNFLVVNGALSNIQGR